jgi:hypothetical protein
MGHGAVLLFAVQTELPYLVCPALQTVLMPMLVALALPGRQVVQSCLPFCTSMLFYFFGFLQNGPQSTGESLGDSEQGVGSRVEQGVG